MDRPDPFFGYSTVLRTILLVVVPAFTVWQFVRLRRALHVFQLEGYKRARFIAWCRSNVARALFLRSAPPKKPLVMTGRAWRILTVSTALSLLMVLGAAAVAHLVAGAPYDLVTWALITAIVFVAAPLLLVAADVLLAPVQSTINRAYLRTARSKLDSIDPIVIGVTGSFGKTSTKFAIVSLLAPAGAALATPSSFNTPLGVCRTINERLSPQDRFFVVEMGAYRRGEIADLARFVRPRVGVLTAIGPAHLERFGSLEAIGATKYELIESLPDDGLAVMNSDDLAVRELADATTRLEVVRYGVDPSGKPDVTASNVEVTRDGTTLTVHADGDGLRVRTRLLGSHSVLHVLAAVAVATKAAGATLASLEEPIVSLYAVEHRLQLIEGAGGVTVIDDAFNSNPEGARSALDVLAAMPARRRVIVTPGMIELGGLQYEANRRFGEHAARVADTLIVVAPVNRRAIIAGAEHSSVEVIVVDTLAEATERLKGLLATGDVVLFENDLPDQYEGVVTPPN